MGAATVVELDELPELRARVADRVVGAQIDMLVLDRLLQPLDEDVVAPAAAAIHADGDVAPLQCLHVSALVN